MDCGIRVRHILERYRSDAALGPFLTERFLHGMQVFGAALALWGTRTNLTARPDDPIETAFHIVDSLMPLVLAHRADLEDLARAFAAEGRVLDFGSGAGFPGLILASACPAHFTLAESRQKRASFLRVAAAEMSLDNVEILPVRLEAASSNLHTFDAILSRASGPPPEFYDIAAHALTPGGFAILYSTPSQRLDLTAARKAGLGSYRRLAYAANRADKRVERVLAVWQALEKCR